MMRCGVGWQPSADLGTHLLLSQAGDLWLVACVLVVATAAALAGMCW